MNKKLIAGVLTVLCFASLKSVAADYTTDNRSNMPVRQQSLKRSESAAHVGILAGITAPEGRFGKTGEYGLDFGYQPFAPIGAGIEISHNEINNSSDNARLERTNVLLKASYNFGGTVPVIRDSYVGVAAGAVFKQDGTDLASAPFAGFDIPLARSNEQTSFTLGANAKYLVVSGSDPDAFSVNGVLKYWY